MPKMIIVNERRCLGCRSCMLACAVAHSGADSLADAIRLPVAPQARVHVEAVGRFGLPIQCQHCEDAPCVTVCPTGAIRRRGESGPVLLDADRCIGCRFCVLACPFGVIELARDGKAVVKCDLCIERTEAGQEPACVSACPTGALRFEDVTEYVRRRRRMAAARLVAEGDEPRQTAPEKANGPVGR